MATTADVTRRIEIDLDAVSAEVQFLPDLEQEWAEEPLSNRVDWHLEWTDLMARAEALEATYRAGEMTASQETRYAALVRTLISVVPILQRLGLPPPVIPFAEAE